jgi:hypothetical protein
MSECVAPGIVAESLQGVQVTFIRAEEHLCILESFILKGGELEPAPLDIGSGQPRATPSKSPSLNIPIGNRFRLRSHPLQVTPNHAKVLSNPVLCLFLVLCLSAAQIGSQQRCGSLRKIERLIALCLGE